MSIYTKTGDQGQTSLFGEDRIFKSHVIFEVLGTLDELNAVLGLVANIRVSDREISKVVLGIQNDLFEIGAFIANKKTPLEKYKKLNARTLAFERIVDEMDKSLPLLKNFILPGGTLNANYLHLARAVCRRLERNLVSLYNNLALEKLGCTKDGFLEVLKYVNRLSDLLFVLARYSNYKAKVSDVIWKSTL